jgi:hypothetical protein
MAKKKVAELFVDVLAEAGVRRIYGVSGDSLNGITDSIRATKRLEWIHVGHHGDSRGNPRAYRAAIALAGLRRIRQHARSQTFQIGHAAGRGHRHIVIRLAGAQQVDQPHVPDAARQLK